MRMEVVFHLRNLLFYGILVMAFWFSLKLAMRSKRVREAVFISILSSALILVPGGFFLYLTEPDMIGKGLVGFIYNISFLIINSINILVFIFYKRSQKQEDSIK
ncbi:hypothetical protein [Mesobacillus harenae]|uniref:hypothetical protein n=1 Tax=Mesobacillus harenae TaxID=2213203 RepID=UPI00158099B7|nr:hypothetical protein [Mesobacillus harenae]